MTKFCPKCGKELPDESHFCLECGCRIDNKSGSSKISDKFSNGKIFLALIFVVLIVGGILILTMGGNGNNQGNADDALTKEASQFSLTVSDVNGHYNNESNDYFYWVEVLFQKVPSNQKDYIVKTTYLDEKGNDVGHETESLSHVYYDTDYPISVGYHTAYKYIDVDSVKVEIIRDGNVIKECTGKADKNKFNFDKPQGNQSK